jgi:hypothetical protein
MHESMSFTYLVVRVFLNTVLFKFVTLVNIDFPFFVPVFTCTSCKRNKVSRYY